MPDATVVAWWIHQPVIHVQQDLPECCTGLAGQGPGLKLREKQGKSKSNIFTFESCFWALIVFHISATWDMKRLQVPRNQLQYGGEKTVRDQIYKATWKSPAWTQSPGNYRNLHMLLYSSCNKLALQSYFHNCNWCFLSLQKENKQTDLPAAWCMSSMQALITDR